MQYFFEVKMVEQSNKQQVLIEDRAILSANGIKGILSFDEDYLELETEEGMMTVVGSDMKVEELDQKEGKIKVVGCITEIGYKNKKIKKKRKIL